MMQEKIWAAMEAIQEMNGAMEKAEDVTPGMQSMGTHAYNILWRLARLVSAAFLVAWWIATSLVVASGVVFCSVTRCSSSRSRWSL